MDGCPMCGGTNVKLLSINEIDKESKSVIHSNVNDVEYGKSYEFIYLCEDYSERFTMFDIS